MRSSITVSGTYGEIALLLLFAAAAGAQKETPRMSPVVNGRPAEVVYVEHRGSAARLAGVQVESRKVEYFSQEGLVVLAAAWSPDGRRVLFDGNGSLGLVDLATREARTLIPAGWQGAPQPQWFASDGLRIAVPLAHRISILGAGPAVDLALEPDDEVIGLVWVGDGRGVIALVSGAKGRFLVTFDAGRGAILSRVPVDCENLLGWRHGQLLATRIGAAGDVAGTLSLSGNFTAVREATGERSEYYLQYAAGVDRLLFTNGAEHSNDPVNQLLTDPGLSGAVPWLTRFSHVTDLAFTKNGQWAVFIDRSRPELSEEPGGDLYLTRTDSNDPILLLRAEPGTVSFSKPAARPN